MERVPCPLWVMYRERCSLFRDEACVDKYGASVFCSTTLLYQSIQESPFVIMHVVNIFISSILLAGYAGLAASQGDPTALITDAPQPSMVHNASSSEVDDGLSKRSPPAGVYVCSGPDWSGSCAWHAITDMACANFPWTTDISFGVSCPATTWPTAN